MISAPPIQVPMSDPAGWMTRDWVLFFNKLYKDIRGKTDVVNSVTLTPSVTSTVVIDPFCGTGSTVLLTATTSTAAASTGVYVVVADGSFTIYHNSTADVNKTFKYVIVG